MTPDILTDTKEVDLLASLASAVQPPNCIVELGVFRGGSLAVLAANAPEGVEVFGIDTWGNEETPEYYKEGSWPTWWEWFSGKNYNWRSHKAAAKRNAPTATLIQSHTAKAGQTWEGPKVGLLYIDADHSYEGVKADYEAWLPHMAEGSSIVFDDYRYKVRGKDHYPGVTKFVDEIGVTYRIGKAGVIKL